ncbi:MAG TPA: aminopeptidase P N-terminal domain-containing protein [Gemmatimonadales bacterium]|nr:aminopeptidase P N-terminal domain-containing protein [Gemmatimonadales bacterium]
MRTPLFATLMLAAAVPSLAGQYRSRSSGQDITPVEYAARRDSLAARMDSGVVIAFGAPDPTGIHQSVQLPAFRYLTGFLEPNAAFLLIKSGGRTTGTLFTASRDPRRALYDGFPPDSATVSRQTGLAVRSLPALRPMVDSLVQRGLPIYDLRDFASADAGTSDSLTRGARFLADLQAGHRGIKLDIRDAHPSVDSLRARKSPAELSLLQRAIDITVASLKETMRSARPGMHEYELQAMVEAGFRRAGADGPSFGSIVGSGFNSTQYHYSKNDRRMQAGDVVVMDVGASYRGYAADVTRTIPVSGKFTPDQRAIYQIVRDAQAAAERVSRPGASWQAWRDTAFAVHARGMARLGLVESADATFDPPWAAQCENAPVRCKQAFLYMAHGLGHGIGLEVHDPPRPYMGVGTFQVGHVFTIEPGVYISTRLLDMLPDTPKNRAMIAQVRKVVERYQNIGVRIEDDYVITREGVEWLSKAPREIQEVEALRLVSSRPR